MFKRKENGSEKDKAAVRAERSKDSKEKELKKEMRYKIEKDENLVDEKMQSNPSPLERAKAKRLRKRKRNRMLKRIVLVIPLLILCFFVMKNKYFNISSITVEGNVQIEAKKVIEDSGLKAGDNIFFFNKRKIVKKMEENPLYKEIDIDRRLPNKIHIKIKERNGKYVLSYGEKFVLVDDEGVVLGIEKDRTKVSEIRGSVIKNMEKGEKIEVKDEEQFKNSLNLLHEAEKADLFFMSLKIDGKQTTIKVYGNLYIKGNYEDVLENIKDGNIKGILSDLYSRSINRGTIRVGEKKELSFTPTFD